MADEILRTVNLDRRFGGVHATRSVNLSVPRGQVRAIIGPNGAGKTTLFNLLTGFLPPQSGQIFFQGRDVTRMPAHRRCHLGLARTFQVTSIFPDFSVRENVQLARLSMQGLLWRLFTPAAPLLSAEAQELLHLVGLGDKGGYPARALAHGERKKLELAIALACDPQLLLLDEPTSGMPVSEKPALMGLVSDVVRTRGLTAILIEHDMDVVFSVADAITVLHQGTVVAEGAPQAVRANPEVQRVYLGEGESAGFGSFRLRSLAGKT